MTEDYKCGFCNRTFETYTQKHRHRCQTRPRNVCKYSKCSDQPFDESNFCLKHKPKVFEKVFAIDKSDIEERKVGVFNVTFHYTMEETVKVEAYNEGQAKDKAGELKTYDGEIVCTPHVEVRKVGEKTEEQVLTDQIVEVDGEKIREPGKTLKDYT